MTINPCRVCGDIPIKAARPRTGTGPDDPRWGLGGIGVLHFLTHACQTPYAATTDEAAAMWNRDNPPDGADGAGEVLDQRWEVGVVSRVPQLARGLAWCVTCGREQEVNAAWRLRNGWPTCCGTTMTIDSPGERAELARQREVADGD